MGEMNTEFKISFSIIFSIDLYFFSFNKNPEKIHLRICNSLNNLNIEVRMKISKTECIEELNVLNIESQNGSDTKQLLGNCQ